MKLAFTLDHEEINQKIPYALIYEGYERIKRGGKALREYKSTFSVDERKEVYQWIKKFYRWYLVVGAPQELTIKNEDIELIERMALFFSSI